MDNNCLRLERQTNNVDWPKTDCIGIFAWDIKDKVGFYYVIFTIEMAHMLKVILKGVKYKPLQMF